MGLVNRNECASTYAFDPFHAIRAGSLQLYSYLTRWWMNVTLGRQNRPLMLESATIICFSERGKCPTTQQVMTRAAGILYTATGYT